MKLTAEPTRKEKIVDFLLDNERTIIVVLIICIIIVLYLIGVYAPKVEDIKQAQAAELNELTMKCQEVPQEVIESKYDVRLFDCGDKYKIIAKDDI